MASKKSGGYWMTETSCTRSMSGDQRTLLPALAGAEVEAVGAAGAPSHAAPTSTWAATASAPSSQVPPPLLSEEEEEDGLGQDGASGGVPHPLLVCALVLLACAVLS